MKTAQLGRTDINVCVAPLGAMYLGVKQDQAASFELLDLYTSRGGNFIDTANIYAHWVGDEWHGGESENLLGEWLSARGNRNDLVIASKVGFGYSDVPTGLTKNLIKAECEKSLKRMGIDTIDLYFAHVDDRNTGFEETLTAFGELVKEGKVRAIGASNFTTFRLAEVNAVAAANGLPRYEVLQQRHSYVRPRYDADFGPQLTLTANMAEYCAAADMSIMAYSAGLGGAYTGEPGRDLDANYLSRDTELRLEALGAVAKELGASPQQVVLAWMMNTPGMMPLVAASGVDQLNANLDAVDLALSAEQMERLNAAGE